MDEKWFAVVDRETGEAVSFGTVLADPLPAHLEAVAIPAQPHAESRWDATTRSVVEKVRPAPVDRVAVFLSESVITAALEKLSEAERLAIEEKLRSAFGGEGNVVD